MRKPSQNAAISILFSIIFNLAHYLIVEGAPAPNDFNGKLLLPRASDEAQQTLPTLTPAIIVPKKLTTIEAGNANTGDIYVAASSPPSAQASDIVPTAGASETVIVAATPTTTAQSTLSSVSEPSTLISASTLPTTSSGSSASSSSFETSTISDAVVEPSRPANTDAPPASAGSILHAMSSIFTASLLAVASFWVL